MTFRAFAPFARPPVTGGQKARRQFMPPEKYAQFLERMHDLIEVVEATPLDWTVAQSAHDPEYLRRWRDGNVTHADERSMGFKWSPDIVTRALRSSGATLAATHDAVTRGWGVNIGGGTHHAFHDRAEGFSFLNDVVIATRHVRTKDPARRVLILDLDVHQGNGTASMLRGEERAFTLSVHARHNYPFHKERSDLDVSLEDGVTDVEYLSVLHDRVFPAMEAFRPDLVFYLAGADVLAGDQLGRFALTLEGVRERDERVFTWSARHQVPLVSVMAGGYNRDADVTIEARLNTVRAGLSVYSETNHDSSFRRY